MCQAEEAATKAPGELSEIEEWCGRTERVVREEVRQGQGKPLRHLQMQVASHWSVSRRTSDLVCVIRAYNRVKRNLGEQLGD